MDLNMAPKLLTRLASVFFWPLHMGTKEVNMIHGHLTIRNVRGDWKHIM